MWFEIVFDMSASSADIRHISMPIQCQCCSSQGRGDSNPGGSGTHC